MKKVYLLVTLLLGCCSLTFSASEKPADSIKSATETFTAGKGAFLLNGEPFVVKAAELHYPRIPREYWNRSIRMVKALGMNTVCLYTFWNAHEPYPDRFDFEGQNDLREFIKLCAADGMKVILRPGPYVCAEWEMGGLPWWLLKKKDIRLRENDPYFLERVDKFQKAVAKEVADLTIDKGGPVIMMQVENEYGSYGIDKPYVANIRDMLRRNFSDKITLFQCDWSSNFLNNGLDDLVWTMNFGTGADIDREFEQLRKVRPDSPLMCSEFWSGWFDKWGANHETRPAADMIAGIEEMLSRNISFSLYMTQGGTSFGHWAGANSPGFAPDVTSYDYDAPVSEQGAVTPKYDALRRVMARYADGKLPAVPKNIPTVRVAPFSFTEVAPLFANLPDPVLSDTIVTMEELDQGYGSVLYRTSLPALPGGGELTVNEPHDFAQIFVDGKLIGILDRRLGQKSMNIPAVKEGARLDILVEAMGRINFGRAIKDFKGITRNVTVTETRGAHEFVCGLKGWTIYPLPDTEEFYAAGSFVPVSNVLRNGERFPIGTYRTVFNMKNPGDTFLNFENFGKGLVYVNGHPLGRIWEIGPQQTLYCPGPWLRKGENEVVVFDVLGPRSLTVEGLKAPLYDRLRVAGPERESEAPDLKGLAHALSAEVPAGSGWKQLDFPAASGSKLVIEVLSTHNAAERAAIAELYLLDKDGKRLPREGWSVSYATSEDAAGGNHTAEKAFDLQESTYWSAGEASVPQIIVIELGGNVKAKALQLLPRMESGAPGSPASIRAYLI